MTQAARSGGLLFWGRIRFLVQPAHAVQPTDVGGPQRGHGQDDKAFAPVAVFAAGRIANDSGGGSVALFEGQARQAADDGLKVVVAGRAVGGDRDQGAKCSIGFSQIADFGTALGGQGLDSQGLPGSMGIAFYKHTLRRRAGLVARFQALPAPSAEGVVDIQAELGEGAAGEGLDHSGQAGFGGGVELPLADSGVFEAVRTGLPGLGPVEHHNPDAAHGAEMVEAPGQDIGVHGTGIVFGRQGWDNPAGDWELGRLRLIRACEQRLDRQAAAGIGGVWGWRRAHTVHHNEAQIGPAAVSEIYGEDGHALTLRLAGSENNGEQ